MEVFKLSKEQLFDKYHTNDSGLSTKEALRRLVDFGENKIQSAKKKSYIKEYLRQYIQFFAVLLEVAAFLAFIADYYVPNEGNNILAYAIIIAVIINATFAFWQEYKEDKAMEHLNITLEVWIDADPEYIPAREAREKLKEWTATN